jgi:hypothetical protein
MLDVIEIVLEAQIGGVGADALNSYMQNVTLKLLFC